MPMPSHMLNARYQLAPFGSPEKLVVVAWLLLSVLFFIPSAQLPTSEAAAESVVKLLTLNHTTDACQLCYVVLHNVDVTQRTFMDVTATDFESFLGRADEQLLMACKADPEERGCDTLRAKIDDELRVYTNVILEQMLGVTTVLEQYGNELLSFLDDHDRLIRRYVSGNKATHNHQSHKGPRAEPFRGTGKRFAHHMWFQSYPSAPTHRRYCAGLCERRVRWFDRPRLYFWRFYVLFQMRSVITWLQQEHVATYVVVTLVGALVTVILRRLLAPPPVFPTSSVFASGWGFRVAVEQTALSGGAPGSTAGHNSGAATHSSGRVVTRGKTSSRRR